MRHSKFNPCYPEYNNFSKIRGPACGWVNKVYSAGGHRTEAYRRAVAITIFRAGMKDQECHRSVEVVNCAPSTVSLFVEEWELERA